MKTKIIIGLFLQLTVLYPAAISPERTAPLSIRPTTADKLRHQISEKSGKTLRPPRETFLMEDDLGRSIPISSVPENVRTDAERWIRKLVRAKWLPADLQTRLQARKDAVLREVRSGDGKVDFKDVGDFIILDFEIESHRFVLLESGRTLVARIQFPAEAELTKVSGEDIVSIVAKYFTMPESAIKPGEMKTEGDDQLRSYTWTNGPSQKEIDRRYENAEEVEWWYRLRLYFDGRMLIVSMPEIANPPQYTARMSLPDRF